MSLNAAMIQLMVDKGLSAQDIADIALAGEKKADPTAAERQRRCRANKINGKKVSRRDVTRDPPIEDNHTPSDLSPNGENHIRPAKPKRRKRGDNGVSLSADWQPTLGPKTQAMVDGWPPGKFDREVRKFRAHAADKGRLSLDWDAALRTWLENADEWMPANDRCQPQQSADEIQNPLVRVVMRNQARREADRAGVEWG